MNKKTIRNILGLWYYKLYLHGQKTILSPDAILSPELLPWEKKNQNSTELLDMMSATEQTDPVDIDDDTSDAHKTTGSGTNVGKGPSAGSGLGLIPGSDSGSISGAGSGSISGSGTVPGAYSPSSNFATNSEQQNYRVFGGLTSVHRLWPENEKNNLRTWNRSDENFYLYELDVDNKGKYISGSFNLDKYACVMSEWRLASREERPCECNLDYPAQLSAQIDAELSQSKLILSKKILLQLNQSIVELLSYDEEDLINTSALAIDKQIFDLRETAKKIKEQHMIDLRQTAATLDRKSELVEFLSLEEAEPVHLDSKSERKLWSSRTEPKHYSLAQWPGKQFSNLSQQWILNDIHLGDDKKIQAYQVPEGSGRGRLVANTFVEQMMKRAVLLLDIAKASNAFTMNRIQNPPNDFSSNYYVANLQLRQTQTIVSSNMDDGLRKLAALLNQLGYVSSVSSHSDSFDVKIQKEVYFTKLAQKDYSKDAWGLASYYVSSKEDLLQLVKDLRYLFDEIYSSQEKKKEIQVKSFQQAKKDFVLSYQLAYNKQAELQGISDMTNTIRLLEEEKEEFEDKAVKLQSDYETSNKELNESERELHEITLRLEGLQADIRRYKEQMHGFSKFLYRFLKLGPYAVDMKKLENRLQFTEDTLSKQEEELSKKERRSRDITIQMELLDKQIDIKNTQINNELPKVEKMKSHLGANFADYQFYKNINSPASQQACPWMDKEFAQLREEVLRAALDLQKAFILSSNEMKQNLARLELLLEGKFTEQDKKESLPYLMASLNLIVPMLIIPQDMFHELYAQTGEEEAGLLIQLDAQRNHPAELVGDFNRASKVICFSDHLQLAKHSYSYSPFDAYLADGFQLDKKYLRDDLAATDYLLGIASQTPQANKKSYPFAVRYRYFGSEPLFSLDNQLCWDNNLLGQAQELVEKPTDFLDRSDWLDIGGSCDGNSLFVPIQADILTDMCLTYVEKHQKLPDISIICYFYAVYDGLKKYIQKNWCKQDSAFLDLFTKEDIFKWLDSHLYLLHEWDGESREEAVFICGGDQDVKHLVMEAFWSNKKALHTVFSTVSRKLLVIGDAGLWATGAPLDYVFTSLSKESSPSKLSSRTVYFIRSGQGEHHAQEQFFGSKNSQLSEKGKEQLEQVRDEQLYPEVDVYYSSTLTRAKESLQKIFGTPMEIHEKPGLNDLQIANWENMTLGSKEAERFMQCWYAGDDLGKGVESYHDLLTRAKQTIIGILDEMDRRSEQSAVLISHNLWLKTYFMNMDVSEELQNELNLDHGNGYKVQFHKVGSVWKQGKVSLIQSKHRT